MMILRFLTSSSEPTTSLLTWAGFIASSLVIRNGVEIFKGQVDQLKRFKDDVKEVAQGFECGLSFAKFNDLQEGDIIEVSTTKEIERQSLV